MYTYCTHKNKLTNHLHQYRYSTLSHVVRHVESTIKAHNKKHQHHFRVHLFLIQYNNVVSVYPLIDFNNNDDESKEEQNGTLI